MRRLGAIRDYFRSQRVLNELDEAIRTGSKTTNEVLQALSQEWKFLDPIEQQILINKLAGKRHAIEFVSAIDADPDFEPSKDLEDFLNSFICTDCV